VFVWKIGFKRKHGREEFVYPYLTILNNTHQPLKFITCSSWELSLVNPKKMGQYLGLRLVTRSLYGQDCYEFDACKAKGGSWKLTLAIVVDGSLTERKKKRGRMVFHFSVMEVLTHIFIYTCVYCYFLNSQKCHSYYFVLISPIKSLNPTSKFNWGP
jgi:hypothetical protein